MTVTRDTSIIESSSRDNRYDAGQENITDEQIHDAIRIINEDFNKENEDIIEVVSAFTNIVGDAKIEFKCQKVDDRFDWKQDVTHHVKSAAEKTIKYRSNIQCYVF